MAKKVKSKGGRPPITPGLQPGEVTPNRILRVPDAEWQLWQDVAESQGQSLSGWIRSILGKAARRALAKLGKGDTRQDSGKG